MQRWVRNAVHIKTKFTKVSKAGQSLACLRNLWQSCSQVTVSKGEGAWNEYEDTCKEFELGWSLKLRCLHFKLVAGTVPRNLFSQLQEDSGIYLYTGTALDMKQPITQLGCKQNAPGLSAPCRHHPLWTEGYEEVSVKQRERPLPRRQLPGREFTNKPNM